MSVIKKIQLPDGTQLDVGVDDTTLVHKTGNETIAGTKTFSSTISGNISGSSASCTGNAATATKATNVNNVNGNGSLKLWTGTLAQYNAIGTKDGSTLYNITDDQDITLSLLQTIYPVGSLYMTANSTCPLASLFGTWTKVASGVVTSVNGEAPVKGTGIAVGYTDGTKTAGATGANSAMGAYVGTYGASLGTSRSGSNFTPTTAIGITTDASKSGMVSTVTSSTYTCNIFRRTA